MFDYTDAMPANAMTNMFKHQCGCDLVATRDQAADLSTFVDGPELLGREPV